MKTSTATGCEWADWRRLKVDNGKSLELYGPLNIDVFNVDRYLINGVPIFVKLYPDRAPFSLMSETPDKAYRIIINQAVLMVRYMEVSPATINSHSTAMDKGDALYYYNKSVITPVSLKSDSMTFHEANCFNGKAPHKIIVYLVSDEAFSGTYSTNAFYFRHYDIESLQVMVDEVSVPHEGYTKLH